MAIGISTFSSEKSLFGKSHWWGMPDMPAGIPFPCNGTPDDEGKEDLLTFICQINLEELATYDVGKLLPASGMLYFFANLDYFLGDYEAEAECLGFWPDNAFKVIYTPEIKELHTHEVKYADGSSAYLPAEEIHFEIVPDDADGHKLLGVPFFQEVEDEACGMVSLLQLDEDERWGLRLYDMGNLNFLISKDALAAADFDKVKLYFHSL